MPQFKFAGMDGVDEVTISSIHVKVGQVVKKGDDLFDIEADKAADTVTSPYDGTIAKVNFSAGDSIKTGDVVIEFTGGDQAKDDHKVKEDIKVTKDIKEVKTEVKSEHHEVAETKAVAERNNKTVLATPIARMVARNLGIDITTVKGTGPNGRVLRADIEGAPGHATKGPSTSSVGHSPASKAVGSGPTISAGGTINVAKIESFGPVDHLTLTPIRKAVAAQMVTSKYTAPHVSLMIDVDATNLINLRTSLKEEAAKPENGAIKLTFMPFFIKAVAKVLTQERFKALNSTLNLPGNELLVKKYYNIGMATDTERGLIVPVIKNADKLPVFEIAKHVNDLAQKGRTGALSAAEMQGGTFTITNFGSAGLKYGTPIINYPEVAILGIGILESKAVLVNDNVVFHNFFPLSISIDHRVVDGAPAGYFMQEIKRLLENPALLLLP
ncbi:MAG: dihydrolipoamide acetyltransferase family protein [Spiroplasma sp.]|nr:dihydrolipoamide acetyltransferase family protein [Spiroplasma sp.]